MSLVVLGLDHRSTPLAERERLVYSREAMEEALPRLRGEARLDECFLISTCNRTELYGSVADLAGASQRLNAVLANDRGLDAGALAKRTYFHHEDAAVSHLFRVASGLESMVLGESQILGQVREALTAARGLGTLGPELDALGRYAVACGRRARTESAISRSPMSYAQAALDLARREAPPLEAAKVLVLGAGEIAESVVRWFRRAGPAITVASRTFERAQALAATHQVSAIALDQIGAVLAGADVVVAALDAPRPLLGEADLAGRVSDLLVIDLGVPRTVAAQVGRLPGVRLHDLDALQRLVDAGQRARTSEVAAVEAIVAEEAARYLAWQRARKVAPTIAQLQERAEAIRVAELERFSELRDLTPEQLGALDSLTRSMSNKLLAGPILRLKEYSQASHGLAYVDVIRGLFGLPSNGETNQAEDDQTGERSAH